MKKKMFRIVADNMQTLNWYLKYEIKEQVQCKFVPVMWKILAQFETDF